MNQTDQPTNQSHSLLTVETALWILVAVVALVLRLARLDAAMLNDREAREAMFAWRAVTGRGMPGTDFSPFLFTANALLFALCGASDRLARLWPVLCGSALALTPFLLRRRIGRVGALATGFCLTFSPTLLFASRQLDGTVVAALAGMLFLGGLVRFLDTSIGEDDQGAGGRAWLTLAAGGLALAVTSGSSAFGLLFALGLTWLGLAWIWPDRGMRWLWARLRPHLNHALAVCLLAGLALSTALGWNLAGLGGVGDLLSAWIARFSPAPHSAVSPLILLTVYELFVLSFGLGGVVWVIRRGHRLGILLGMWAGAGILLLLLMPGRTGLDTLWALLPLTLLAGIAIEQLVRGLREQGDWLGEGLHIPVVVLLWTHFYLMLARYAVSGSPTEQNTYLALALLTVALQGLLTTVFALALRLRFGAALRSVAVGTGLVLLAMMLSAGWGVAYVRPFDPREPLVREPTGVEVRDLVRTLRDLSWRETGFPLALPFALKDEPGSVLAWYLRDFTAKEEKEKSVLVTTQTDLKVQRAGYVGQDFALRRSWDFNDIACTWGWPPQCHSVVGWWLFRSAPTEPAVDQWATIWMIAEE